MHAVNRNSLARHSKTGQDALSRIRLGRRSKPMHVVNRNSLARHSRTRQDAFSKIKPARRNKRTHGVLNSKHHARLSRIGPNEPNRIGLVSKLLNAPSNRKPNGILLVRHNKELNVRKRNVRNQARRSRPNRETGNPKRNKVTLRNAGIANQTKLVDIEFLLRPAAYCAATN